MASAPEYSSGVARIAANILPANTTAYVVIYDNSASSTHVTVEALNIVSDDSAIKIGFARYDGSTSYPIGTVAVGALAGTDGVANRVNALGTGATTGDLFVGTLNGSGIRVIEIPPGGKLQAKALTAVNTNKTVTITGWVRLYA